MAELDVAGAHGIVDYAFASVFLALLMVMWRQLLKSHASGRTDLKAAAKEAAEEREAATKRAVEERSAADKRLAAEREAADQRVELVMTALAESRADFFAQLEKRDERHADALRSITREFADATRSTNERVMLAVVNLQNMADTLGRRVGRRGDGG